MGLFPGPKLRLNKALDTMTMKASNLPQQTLTMKRLRPNAHAHTSTNKFNFSANAIPKRPRFDATASEPEPIPPYTEDIEDGPSGDPSVLKMIHHPQAASKYMNEFEKIFWKIMKAMLAVEAPESVGQDCSCKRSSAKRLYYCNECFDFPSCCAECWRERHRYNPFHWAEFWTGTFFERKDISDLGYVLPLRHGLECSSCAHAPTLEFTVVDVTGIHATKVAFCQCAGCIDNRVDLLLRSQIFPSTATQPTLGFTFNVLRDFHLQTLTSKKSSYDYLTALSRRTNNAFSDKLGKVPYTQFLRAQRVWRALTTIKRSGQAHNIDKLLPHRRPGNLVVPCFACPEPNFNVSDKQLNDTDLPFLNTLVLMMDGHFGLQRLSKVDDPDDVSLLGGGSLFPPDIRYNDYVRNIVAHSEEKTTCSKFSAVDLQNKLKFKGACITGVVGVSCNRHMIFHSLVDLQKGERYANADFALAFALERIVKEYGLLLPAIFTTYDVNCQFYKKIKARWSECFPHLLEYLERMTFLVPKKHLDGHKEDCKYKFSMNYTDGTGRAHGEGIEVSWSESKQAGGSTRQMNHGHRQDTLSDYHLDWNWSKNAEMARTLSKRLIKAVESRTEQIKHFLGLCKSNGQKNVEEWQLLSTEPYIHAGQWESVYRYKRGKLPSQATVLQSLERSEREIAANSTLAQGPGSKKTCSRVIFNGIKIQDKQRELVRDSLDPSAKAHQQILLSAEIQKWRKSQVAAFPHLEEMIINTETTADPEKENLLLPSDIDITEHKSLGLEAAAEYEFHLREGQANDTIKAICNIIMHGMVLQDEKRERARGVAQNTRSLKQINTVKNSKASHCAKYRHVRTKILKLQPNHPTITTDYPELKDEDTYAKNAASSRKLGDGKGIDSWIWSFGRLKAMSEKEKAEFLIETQRVQWFRARADMERWVEEVEILEEELRRVKRSCEKMAEIWTNLSESDKIPLNPRYADPNCSSNISALPTPGHRAYAAQKASMYQIMAVDADKSLISAGGGYPETTETLSQYVRRRRPATSPTSVDWERWKAEKADNDKGKQGMAG